MSFKRGIEPKEAMGTGTDVEKRIQYNEDEDKMDPRFWIPFYGMYLFGKRINQRGTDELWGLGMCLYHPFVEGAIIGGLGYLLL